ncbi:hypothetical protein AC578_10845 [Pseudocercospora eumusae]|uniref:Uncharacterized protein n=1 Tax=Pseudocercospora eumusae TaxID=321146 RepID=A0A139H923_9PEZI|nr:hypothetical protein AC578_10845 [Pseudocercospora eumusae]
MHSHLCLPLYDSHCSPLHKNWRILYENTVGCGLKVSMPAVQHVDDVFLILGCRIALSSALYAQIFIGLDAALHAIMPCEADASAGTICRRQVSACSLKFGEQVKVALFHPAHEGASAGVIHLSSTPVGGNTAGFRHDCTVVASVWARDATFTGIGSSGTLPAAPFDDSNMKGMHMHA